VLVEIKVPILAESVTDASLLDWQKQEGELVTRGDNLIDLETDKVTLEVTATETGVLKQILKHTGDTVLSGEVLAVIDTEASASASAPAPAAAASAAAPAATDSDDGDAKANPAARKLIADKGLDAAMIAGSGKDGRITKADVIAHLDSNPAPAASPAPAAAQPAAPAQVISGDRPEQRVAMTRLRKRASQRLLEAQRDNAILTTFNEVNMQPIMDLRTRHKEAFEKKHGVRLGFMSFFTKAAVESLKQFPIMNSSVDGDDILYRGYFDIGIAVSSPRGLVVPIIRDADLQSIADLEASIAGLGQKAREGKLDIDDLTGGTFTITNGGTFGSMLSTPIINPPQSAILGMHNIVQRPVAENGQVVIRPVMYLAVSYDHRIIDGSDAVRFLVSIKNQLEDPARMLLGL
jgi:2-oxoglutarate dehydrogenase E2 component (dihydrolipoamide succinyltransferase)